MDECKPIFIGFVDFPVQTLTSGMAPLNSSGLTSANRCLLPGVGWCKFEATLKAHDLSA